MLDLGSGLGAPARFIARRFAASVVSLDAEPNSQSAARLHAAAEGLSARCPQVLGLGEALPFAGGVFDAAWSQDALCHMRKERTLGEVARVVRGGGLFVFSDWLARDRLTAGELRELELRWSFPSLLRLGEYAALLDASGFDLLLAEDVTHLRGPRRSVPEDQGAWEAIFARRHGGDRLTEQEARGRSWVELLEAGRTGYGMFVAKRRAPNANATP